MNKILVVEDEDIIAMNLEEHLTEMGYEVAGIAASGEEAIEKARELRPDLILMDIAMPGEKDGVEASEDIRSEMDVPIIFLTAYADEELIKRAKMIEPSGYIVKPYEDRELRAAIEVALHKKDKEKLYKQQQGVKRINIIAKLREDDEKIRELKARNSKLREALEKLELSIPQLQGTHIDASTLNKHLDFIIVGILAEKLVSDDIQSRISEKEIIEGIHRKFGIHVDSNALHTSVVKLKEKGIITGRGGKMTITLPYSHIIGAKSFILK